jgi:hypothetical protein
VFRVRVVRGVFEHCSVAVARTDEELPDDDLGFFGPELDGGPTLNLGGIFVRFTPRFVDFELGFQRGVRSDVLAV